jgi:sugar lactone lactonase YvrE
MRGIPVRAFDVSLLLLAGVLAGGMAAAQEQATTEPNATAQLKTVQTIDPGVLQPSLRDRLSGEWHRQVPFRMATDSQGRILVTEPFGSLVTVYDTKDGKRWQIHGDKAQRMVFPTYIAVDADDNIYVSEPLLAAVAVYRPDGHFLRAIGGDRLLVPFGLALDKANRRLYVADHYKSEIQVYSLDGQLLQVISSRGLEPGQLREPCDLVLHHGMLFALDTGNARFQMFDLDGNAKGVTPFGNDRWPVAFALDAAGNLYYVDMESLGMQVASAAGGPIAALDVKLRYGQPSSGAAYPSFMSVLESPDGNVLALRPALTVEEVRVEPAKKGGSKPSPEQPQ